MAKCKYCGAEVTIGERCTYCGSKAESWYYSGEEKKQEAETKEKEWGWKKDPYIYPRHFYSPVGYTLWDPWGRRL